MGSLTNTASLNIMQALFPASTTGLTVLASAAAASSLKIYNNTPADSVGIYSRNATNVIHQMTLILGSTSATGNPAPSVGLGDANVLANTLVNGGGISAGTITFANQASYSNTPGTVGASVPMVASSGWLGWTLTQNVNNKGQAVNNGAITFPTFTGTPAVHVWGWCVSANASAAGTAVNPASTTALVASSPTLPTILAYGDLSFARTVSQGDTPSFTSGAVVITLD
jgi:hypothetical protein